LAVGAFEAPGPVLPMAFVAVASENYCGESNSYDAGTKYMIIMFIFIRSDVIVTSYVKSG